MPVLCAPGCVSNSAIALVAPQPVVGLLQKLLFAQWRLLQFIPCKNTLSLAAVVDSPEGE